MKGLPAGLLASLASLACGDSSGTGGAGGAPAVDPLGGALMGGFPPATCYVDPSCAAGDEAVCVCNGCDPGGCYDPAATPAIESDCTCAICGDHPSCGGCDENGECDPFLERCDCIDCAGFAACQ